MTMPSLISQTCRCLLVAVLFLLAACNRPDDTIREIKQKLEIFKANPNMATLEDLDKSFDKIQAQIDAMQAKGDAVQADRLGRVSAAAPVINGLEQRISYLEEGDWVVITRDGAQVYDAAGKVVTREIVASGASAAASSSARVIRSAYFWPMSKRFASCGAMARSPTQSTTQTVRKRPRTRSSASVDA